MKPLTFDQMSKILDAVMHALPIGGLSSVHDREIRHRMDLGVLAAGGWTVQSYGKAVMDRVEQHNRENAAARGEVYQD